MTYETTEQEAGELTALAAIKRHYPIIAGRAMQLQQAGEDKAALAWAAVAGDFYTVLAAKKAPQLSGVISSSQIEDFFNIWHRGGPGVNGSVFEWVARRVNETLSTKEPNTLPVPELAAKRIHDAIERGYSKWEAANCSDPSCGCVAVFIEREVLPLLAENTLGAGELTALDVRDALLAAGYGTVRTPLNADATPEIVKLLNAALAEKAPQGVKELREALEICAIRSGNEGYWCLLCGASIKWPNEKKQMIHCQDCLLAAAPKPAPPIDLDALELTAPTFADAASQEEFQAGATPAPVTFWDTWFCPAHKPTEAHPTGTCFVCNALNNAMGIRCGMCGDTGLQNGKPCPQFGCKVGAFVASGGGVERPHGLVNELEREIIRLNKTIADWIREFNMYRNAWQREIGGYIRRKHHEIDGFVLRTQDALKEAEERGRQASAECVRELEETVNDLLNNLTCSCSATLNQCPRCKLAVEDAKEALTRVPPRTK
jgi:hypothetical protein